MSTGKNFLHSHSGLERELKFKKDTVLVDEEYGELFLTKTPFKYNQIHYLKVNILDFVNKGGQFKNLMQ